KGLFGAQYVEENHFLFPSLKVLMELRTPEKKQALNYAPSITQV
ncbi:MAG: DUF3155 domain-containing protein, partial [Trichodesmium sp. St15_bin1_1]|nr:DUF3155 domain-containing protein [Trichodesmium sp. St15_bin1_1]